MLQPEQVGFCFLYIHSHNRTNSNLPSRLELAFLLEIRASFPVPNAPIYMMITQIFNVSPHDQHDTSKMLAFVNQSEVPFKQ